MTIKQQGGIFGRNPSFNDLEAEQVTVNGRVNIQSNRPQIFLHEIDRTDNNARIEVTGDLLRFAQVDDANSNVVPRVTLEMDTGNFTVNDGNLVIGTSGKGIDFSATSGTGTSKLFDDYEQGTFSPVVKGTTSNPSVTSGTAYGRYTKIGNRVFGNVFMRQVWSSAGSGTLYVDGFPYVMFENQSPGISLGLTNLVGTISNGYLTTVYGTSGCAAVLTGASGVTGSNRYITFTFQYVTGEN